MFKISILTPDLSHNCLGRAYLLAKILQKQFQVEIVGPMFRDNIWPPVAKDISIKYKYIRLTGKPREYWQPIKLLKYIDGHVIYASKPLFTSFGIGLIKKYSDNKPLVLDIDDWQLGMVKSRYGKVNKFRKMFKLGHSLINWHYPSSFWNSLWGESFYHLADDITVSGRFLQKKFGGEIIWHARDTDLFNPKNYHKNKFRKKYGFSSQEKIILFLGTPGLFKGLDDLIKAISLIHNSNLRLLIVGLDSSSKYSQFIKKYAQKTLNNRFIAYEIQNFKKIPEFMSIADVVVIPQKSSFSTIGQVPAKIFDAMAMAKPIISTNVSDVSEILENCGWVVESDKPPQIAKAINYVINHPREAIQVGKKARQKCIKQYSFEAVEKVLIPIFEKYKK